MRIKKFVLTSSVVLSTLGSSLAFATEISPTKITPMTKITQTVTSKTPCVKQHTPHHSRSERLLTVPQRAELKAIMQAMLVEMRPLLKEKQALRLQLMGKIATPNLQWSEINSLLSKVNENNAKITNLFVKTEFTSFQKLGVILPFHPKHHAYRHHEHQNDGKWISHYQYC